MANTEKCTCGQPATVTRVVFGATFHNCADCAAKINNGVKSARTKRQADGMRSYSSQVRRYSR